MDHESNPYKQTVVEVTGKQLLVPRIIWFALVISQFQFGFILWKFGGSGSEPASKAPLDPHLLQVFGGVSVLLAFVLPSILKRLSMKDMKGESRTMQQAIVPFILRLALLESCTLWGFIGAHQSNDISRFWPFLLVALAGFLVSFPTKEFTSKF